MTTRREFLAQSAAISATACVMGAANIASAQPVTLNPEAKRSADLELFLKVFSPTRPPQTSRMNTHDKTWEEWVRRTGELPPKFEVMPSVPGLPDPLILTEGGRQIAVTNEALWNRQKRWIRSQVEQWVFGRMPPPPDNLRALVTATRHEGTTTVRDVRLEFGPDHRAILHLQLIIPDGSGPFPVFLTNHSRTLPWLYTAVRRCYIGCFYAAHDPAFGGGVDDSDQYIDIYPEYDFSCLARWAWSASRAVDYLVTLPEIDPNKIGLAGHSRYGKQALLAAAFDERIKAVVPSSGCTGECDPWRFTADMFVNESVELLTASQPSWFHPRLRFFAGREDKLPVDQNMLMAMIAPRGLMLYSGYAEHSGNPFGYEQSYRSVQRVYRFLEREENLWLHLRQGEHDTAAVDVEHFIDFFDSVFGRKHHPKSETFILGYSFERWQQVTQEKVDPFSYPQRSVGDFLKQEDGLPISSVGRWEEKRKTILQNISHLLGEAPPRVPFESMRSISERDLDAYGFPGGWLGYIFERPFIDQIEPPRSISQGMGAMGIPFGAGLGGVLFYPANADGKPRSGTFPAVIWLHPFSYHTGWSCGLGAKPYLPSDWAYTRDSRPSFQQLVNRGFAIFAFDQLGFGARIHEKKHFYDRYPRWSILGSMIEDTQAAISALCNLKEIDSSRIFLMGYALGGKVGLLTAAYESRVKGVVSVCGVDPLRLDTPDKGTEGIRQYSHLHGLLPRLGFFVGHEDRVPFDFDEVLACVAPKPTLVVAPTLDRYARLADVEREVEASKRIYSLLGHPEALQLQTPCDINRFAERTQDAVFDWLAHQ